MTLPNRAPWINVAVGILAIAAPFLVRPTTVAATWISVITGIVIAVVAIIELSVYVRSTHMNYWAVISLLAGVWLLISTTFARGNTALLWSDITLGIIAIVTSLVALSYERLHAEAAIHSAQH